jgi:hypothetical protein
MFSLRKDPTTQQAAMILIPFVLLLLASVGFAQAPGLTQNEFVSALMNAGPVSHPSVGDVGSPVTNPSILLSREDFWRNQTFAAAPMFAGDH